jgi:hypothetical protein
MKKIIPIIWLILISITIFSCGGGSSNGGGTTNSSTATNGTNGHSIVFKTVTVLASPTGLCGAAGGTNILLAQDLNDDGILNAGDGPASTVTVCNGTNGQQGPPGANGHSVAFNMTSITTPELRATSGCTNGGTAIAMALDINDNGHLDVQDTPLQTAYVCNGLNGQPGQPAHAVLFDMQPAANTVCPNGGTVITLALDINDNGQLDSTDTPLQTSALCNGINGQPGQPGAIGHAIVASMVPAGTDPAQPANYCAAGGTTILLAVDTNDDLDFGATDTPLTSSTICNGINGQPGPQGHSIVYEMASASQAQCTNGGTVIFFAMDINDNGVYNPTVDIPAQSTTVCNGETGPQGSPAPPTPYTPVGLVYPCGQRSVTNEEVLLRLSDGSLLVSLTQNNYARFSILSAGTYHLTDGGPSCTFTVDNHGNITSHTP